MLNAFTRKRRLPFEALVLFLIQKINTSLSVCLSEFFFDTIPPTKGALTQARSFLCPKVFKRLNLFVCGLFYRSGHFKKWKGFRVLSVDGSTLRLPDHPSLKEKFSRHAFGAKKQVKHWMSRISFLYDVLNNVVIDAQMESFDTAESTLCDQHLGFLKKGDLVIFDRYYASHYLFSVLLHKQVHFLFRMRDHSWKCVREFIASGLKQQIVELEVYKYSKVAKKIPSNVDKNIRIRLVKHINRSGKVSVYATSLLDDQAYSNKSIINLYKQRWGIEEAYKTLKARLDVVHFSGKTVQAIQQDFYANVFLITLTSLLKSELAPVLKTKEKTENNENRTPIINNTFAIAQAKQLLKKMYFSFEKIQEWIHRFIILVQAKIEYSRKGQSNPRKSDKGYNRGFSQNYKTI